MVAENTLAGKREMDKAQKALRGEVVVSNRDKLKTLRAQALALGVDKASEEIKNQILALTSLLFETAGLALLKTQELVEISGGKYDINTSSIVEQLRYLTPVWTNALQAGQLISGRPTSAQTVEINDVRQKLTTRLNAIAAVREAERITRSP